MGQGKRKPYAKRACLRCRHHRKKCQGSPCELCVRAGVPCVFPEPEEKPARATARMASAVAAPAPPPPGKELALRASMGVDGLRELVERLETLERSMRLMQRQMPVYVLGSLAFTDVDGVTHVDEDVANVVFGRRPSELLGRDMSAMLVTRVAEPLGAWEGTRAVLEPGKSARALNSAEVRYALHASGDVVRVTPRTSATLFADHVSVVMDFADAPTQRLAVPADGGGFFRVCTQHSVELLLKAVHHIAANAPEAAYRTVERELLPVMRKLRQPDDALYLQAADPAGGRVLPPLASARPRGACGAGTCGAGEGDLAVGVALPAGPERAGVGMLPSPVVFDDALLWADVHADASGTWDTHWG